MFTGLMWGNNWDSEQMKEKLISSNRNDRGVREKSECIERDSLKERRQIGIHI